MAGAETHQPCDGGMERIRTDRAHDLVQKRMIRLLPNRWSCSRERQKNRNRKISHMSPHSAHTIAALSASPRTHDARTLSRQPVRKTLTGGHPLC